MILVEYGKFVHYKGINVRNTARVNLRRIMKMADHVSVLPIEKPLNFYDITTPSGENIVFRDMYPPLHADGVIDFFFFAMVHNYGFWRDDGEKYVEPVVGKWNGKDTKGSDLLWKMLRKAWGVNSTCLSPAQLRQTSRTEIAQMFADDRGPMGFFDTDEREELTRDYARWFRSRRMAGQSPAELVAYANEHADPVQALRDILTHPENGVPGYREDPLSKKAELLLMALTNRPDQLLRVGANTTWNPMIDYHIMRIFLRTGCVTIPSGWVDENSRRRITTREIEGSIRHACFRAMRLLAEKSGRTIHELDNLFWSARRFCPEMTEPDCTRCILFSACPSATGLFQPVFRTTLY